MSHGRSSDLWDRLVPRQQSGLGEDRWPPGLQLTACFTGAAFSPSILSIPAPWRATERRQGLARVGSSFRALSK